MVASSPESTLWPQQVWSYESKAVTMAFMPFPLHTFSASPVLQTLPSQQRQAIPLSNIWASSPNGISLRRDPPVGDPAWNFLESCLLGEKKWEWGVWRYTGMVKKNKIQNKKQWFHLSPEWEVTGLPASSCPQPIQHCTARVILLKYHSSCSHPCSDPQKPSFSHVHYGGLLGSSRPTHPLQPLQLSLSPLPLTPGKARDLK